MRTALFIDAAYFDRVCRDAFGEKSGAKKIPLAVDFRRVAKVLAGEKPWHIGYYHCMPYRADPPDAAQQAAYDAKGRFISFLTGQRWDIREGRLESRGPEGVLVQKRTDVQLAVDLVRLAWKKEIGRAILVAGDADFVPAVEDARAAGVHVILRHEPSTAHADLVTACNEARPLIRAELEAIRLPRSGA